jgi:phage/plasmid-associated DNA primase
MENITIPSGYLQRTQQSGPAPETLELRGKRYVNSSEPPENQTVQGGVVKPMTGGDRVRARDLYAGGKLNIPLNVHLFILCNRMPKIDLEDGGIVRRVEFLSQFVDSEKEVDESNHKYLCDEPKL